MQSYGRVSRSDNWANKIAHIEGLLTISIRTVPYCIYELVWDRRYSTSPYVQYLPFNIAWRVDQLSLVLWEKLFEGCLAGGHFFAGTVQYCSFLRAIFESNDSKKRYSGHTGIMTTIYFYALKKEAKYFKSDIHRGVLESRRWRHVTVYIVKSTPEGGWLVGGQLAGGERFADGTEGSKLAPVDPFFCCCLKLKNAETYPTLSFVGPYQAWLIS